ncbi:hypothetical protein HN800_04855 [bacterium]|jgi:hypothetical protein|nr:hypothetical protein [bacterium]MBT4495199.1 hypothetical protein [bacterium]MBT5401769.1 hypothetical protein [bacterium]MBT5942055.1 hypothetical protein [bacterium]MBT6067635.1 hypothetical protein [bacterium]
MIKKKEHKKLYKARLQDQRTIVVGWPRYKHEEKKSFLKSLKALLF